MDQKKSGRIEQDEFTLMLISINIVDASPEAVARVMTRGQPSGRGVSMEYAALLHVLNGMVPRVGDLCCGRLFFKISHTRLSY